MNENMMRGTMRECIDLATVALDHPGAQLTEARRYEVALRTIATDLRNALATADLPPKLTGRFDNTPTDYDPDGILDGLRRRGATR